VTNRRGKDPKSILTAVVFLVFSGAPIVPSVTAMDGVAEVELSDQLIDGKSILNVTFYDGPPDAEDGDMEVLVHDELENELCSVEARPDGEGEYVAQIPFQGDLSGETVFVDVGDWFLYEYTFGSGPQTYVDATVEAEEGEFETQAKLIELSPTADICLSRATSSGAEDL
jgi:hypothetical protein